MTDVFNRLLAEPLIPVKGVHWASLLNAYGCTEKNLEKAVATFESIESHPSSSTSLVPMPDVICYEGLFNVLLANERVDLIEIYLNKMTTQFITPTACM